MTNMAKSQYAEGDLVWAKVRGFPPWPALITNAPMECHDGNTKGGGGNGGSGKYEVRFFGTGETAALKAAELFDYYENRKLFEVQRKQRGFNHAVEEARRVAAQVDSRVRRSRTRRKAATIITTDVEPSTTLMGSSPPTGRSDTPLSLLAESTSLSSPSSSLGNTPPRLRRASHSSSDEAVVRRGRLSSSAAALGAGTLKSAMVHNSGLDVAGGAVAASASSRPRRVKRVSYSERVVYSTDLRGGVGGAMGSGLGVGFAPSVDFVSGADPVLGPADLGAVLVSVGGEVDPLLSLLDVDSHHAACSSSTAHLGLDLLANEATSTRRSSRRRRRSSRLFEDLLALPTTPSSRKASKSPSTPRSRSISSSARSRLVSGGLSDAFNELIEAAHLFNPNELMAAIDQLPSEDDRPATPEEPLPMPVLPKKCIECGCQCELLGNKKWCCTNKTCLKWNGVHQPLLSQMKTSSSHLSFSPLSSPERGFSSTLLPLDRVLPPNRLHRKRSGSTVAQEVVIVGPTSDDEKSVRVGLGRRVVDNRSKVTEGASISKASPQARIENGTAGRQPASGRRAVVKDGRPRVYKVEKTPPMTANGRLCVFCSGQVRPQMCGGNKHRWRCVDKRCRKWYGWVRLTDEIPSDLGKKGRWKDLAIKIHNHEQQRRQRLGALASASDDAAEDQVTTGLTPKALLEGIFPQSELLITTPSQPLSQQRPKRKYARKRRLEEEEPRRAVSPLTLLQQSYEPSKMEHRGRWWLSNNNNITRRLTAHSPERAFATSALNTAAAMRTIGAAMSAATHTRADEGGSVNGTLDLLMDTVVSSMAPLLTLVEKIPQVGQLDPAVKDALYRASLPHTPIFQ